MKNTIIHPDQIIKVNFSGSAKALNPVVYKEGNQFFCLLGEDAKKGVSGSGKTIEDAIDNWDSNLQIRLKAAEPNDKVVQLVRKLLTVKKPVIDKIQRFYDQFRPLQKK